MDGVSQQPQIYDAVNDQEACPEPVVGSVALLAWFKENGDEVESQDARKGATKVDQASRETRNKIQSAKSKPIPMPPSRVSNKESHFSNFLWRMKMAEIAPLVRVPTDESTESTMFEMSPLSPRDGDKSSSLTHSAVRAVEDLTKHNPDGKKS